MWSGEAGGRDSGVVLWEEPEALRSQMLFKKPKGI